MCNVFLGKQATLYRNPTTVFYSFTSLIVILLINVSSSFVLVGRNHPSGQHWLSERRLPFHHFHHSNFAKPRLAFISKKSKTNGNALNERKQEIDNDQNSEDEDITSEKSQNVRYRARVAYDGTKYSGWQVQSVPNNPNHRTVQVRDINVFFVKLCTKWNPGRVNYKKFYHVASKSPLASLGQEEQIQACTPGDRPFNLIYQLTWTRIISRHWNIL
mmetsp:Transcript_36015/g.41740  ORF Transcript_36015/g.41740 Transcript_36015/m.41740 type:complete len:216 (+) Transcript_36015:46-693(+)